SSVDNGSQTRAVYIRREGGIRVAGDLQANHIACFGNDSKVLQPPAVEGIRRLDESKICSQISGTQDRVKRTPIVREDIRGGIAVALHSHHDSFYRAAPTAADGCLSVLVFEKDFAGVARDTAHARAEQFDVVTAVGL